MPWNEAEFREEVATLGSDFEPQIRDCRENVWLLIVRSDGPVDFGEVSLSTAPNQVVEERQAPWMEENLSDGRVAFFLHHFNPDFGRWPREVDFSLGGQGMFAEATA